MSKATTAKRRRVERTAQSDRAASRELLRRLEERLDGKLVAGRAAEYDAGMLVERIASEGLYVLVKPTLREYLDTRFRETGYSTLHRYRFVAKRFTRASVKKHGSHLLWLGLQYLDATPEDEKPAELLRMTIVLADGSRKPFAKVTPRELKAAIVRLGGDPDGQAEPKSLPRGAGARIEKLEAELGRGLAAEDPRPRLRHRVVVRGGKRRVLVSFLDVEIDELDRFTRSVQRGAKG